MRLGTLPVTCSSNDNLPSLSTLQANAYQPTYLNRARYQAITMMSAYNKWSFEELRLAYFREAIMRETVRVVPAAQGARYPTAALYQGAWMPRQVGTYRIEVRLNGHQIEQSMQFDVGAASSRQQVDTAID